MKTLKLDDLTKLQRLVIEQLGYDEIDKDCATTLRDMMNNGINGGFSGFIYYSETCKFFDDNRDLILTHLQDLAEDLGEDMLTMISNFNCLTDSKGESLYTPTEIMNAIYVKDDENERTIKNALTWAVAEEVPYQLEDEIENILNDEDDEEEED